MWPGACPSPGKSEDRTHRYPHRPSIQRVSAGRVDQDGIKTESCRRAKDCADIGVIDESLEHHNAPCLAHHLFDGGQRSPRHRGKRAAVYPISGDLVHRCLLSDKDNGASREIQIPDCLEPPRRGQHRANGVAGEQRTRDDLVTLGHEEPLCGLLAAPELHIGELAIVRDAWICDVGDLRDLHHRTNMNSAMRPTTMTNDRRAAGGSLLP